MSHQKEEITDEILINLRKITQAMSIHSRALHRQHAITAPQLVVLREIQKNGKEISVGKLAKRVSLSNATLTSLVDRLEQAGHVQRSRNEKDRRQIFLTLTDKGLEIVKKSPPLFQERFLHFLDDMDEGEQIKVRSVLSKLAAVMNHDQSPSLDESLRLDLSVPDGVVASVQMLLHTALEESTESKEKKTLESGIYIVRHERDFPLSLSRQDLALFLHEHLKPYEDSVDDISAGLDYALNNDSNRKGFVLLLYEEQILHGALVMLDTGMTGYVPEHLLLFVAVHKAARGRGLGAQLIRRAQATCTGNIKLHVEYDNPARRLYKRLGFESNYAEMRWTRESASY